ncbi:MAG: DUF835 domain-containing protein [Candidatus Hydrothermarchaeales archaeon]
MMKKGVLKGNDVSAHKRAEEALKKRAHDLSERVKALDCLYGIADLVEKPRILLGEILQGTIDLIPPSWQYPEITCGRIVFEGQEYKTANFNKTDWAQFSDIVMHGDIVGAVEVYYLEEKPAIDEGPFLKEERRLINAIAERLGRIAERKRAEEELQSIKEFYQSILESIIEGVWVTDKDDKIYYANRGMGIIAGIPLEQIMGASVLKDFPESILEYFKPYYSKAKETLHPLYYDAVPIVSPAGRQSYQSGWLIPRLKDGRFDGMICTVKDVTEDKKAEEEMKRRLMKYNLEDGSLYLIQEPIPALSMEVFKDLLKVGYRGVVISRTPEEKFIKNIDGDVEFFWISESGGEKALSSKIRDIQFKLENLPRRNAILIERLDYLVFKNGFEETLSFVQHLRELAYLARHVVLLSVDPSTFAKRELRLLEKEAMEVEPMHKVKMTEKLFVILRFIYEQNSRGIKPAHKDVGLEVGISRPTVRKRIRQLVFAGYLVEVLKGNRKVLELTDKGKILLLK